jgi:UPF0755 protein
LSGVENKQRGRRRWYHSVLALIMAVGLVAASVVAWMALALRPVSKQTGSVRFTIRPGESVDTIAQDLFKAGLIRNATALRLYLSVTHQGAMLRAGTYRLAYGEPVSSLVQALTKGGAAEAVQVTIPEGFTVEQIADRLAAEGVCSRSAFIHAVQYDRFNESFLRQLPHDPRIKYRLEGYLFPDTYDFEKGESAHAVVDEMLADFQQRVADPLASTIRSSGQTLPQVVTEASLIEKEARVSSERPLVASVIDNRLHHKPPMKLQIDATLEYILGHRDVITVKDTRVDNPYNTYQHYGLPPGPIANPGLPSIEAVLHPAHTDYLYYVVKNDGSGEHYFSSTYAQQLKNEAKSRHNLQTHS